MGFATEIQMLFICLDHAVKPLIYCYTPYKEFVMYTFIRLHRWLPALRCLTCFFYHCRYFLVLKSLKIHTISTKDMYKKSPPVIANIHCRINSSVETASPTYNPMNAVKADKKFNNIAFFILNPLFNKIAKSPETDFNYNNKRWYNANIK